MGIFRIRKNTIYMGTTEGYVSGVIRPETCVWCSLLAQPPWSIFYWAFKKKFWLANYFGEVKDELWGILVACE